MFVMAYGALVCRVVYNRELDVVFWNRVWG